MAQKKPKRFVRTWRNKFLTTEAQSLDDMIVALEAATSELRQMKEAGVKMGGSPADDYAELYTDDPAVAKRFGMHPEETE